jgi:putative oxygen-independent coproporphyrinogen III oxidase
MQQSVVGDALFQLGAGVCVRAGVYVHFPWCLAKCPYCDFVSFGTEKGAIDHDGYADAVIQELDRRAESLGGRRIESVFFGGGTPSLWQPRALGRVLARVKATLEHADELEVTVECNPTSLDEDGARALVDVGVGRVSIGVQSLRDERLKYLGRLHDAAGARRAIGDAQRAKVPRVSGDLIFGLPEQSPADATAEATELCELGLDHLSAYQLTIEPGTRFGELAKRGRLPLAEEGAVAESFLSIEAALGVRGLRHYAISNYARPGQEARHNLGYWRGDEYLGLGCAAYGFVMTGPEQGVRYRNDPSPERYVQGAPSTQEPIDAATRVRERIMLGLRVTEGIDLDGDLTPERERSLAWLEQRGRVVRQGSRVRIPPDAWLWADDTAARLF